MLIDPLNTLLNQIHKGLTIRIVLCLIYFFFLFFANLLNAKDNIISFPEAKVILRNQVFDKIGTTFYCGCKYTPKGKSGGIIDFESCGYKPRKSVERAKRLEWEHIVPAWYLGHHLACWKEGNERCIDKNSKKFKGRKCCSKVDTNFIKAEGDLMNLVPEVGELNGDRGALPYGVVPGEIRKYGQCDFEADKKVAEPKENIRGDVARVWLYMMKKYNLVIADDIIKTLKKWETLDPIDKEENYRKSLLIDLLNK